jgi:biotin transport system substrate-specific component
MSVPTVESLVSTSTDDRSSIAALHARYADARRRAFGARHEAGTPTMVALSLGMAGLTALAAQLEVTVPGTLSLAGVVIPLPFTPVPITGQTFAVLLSGVVLGTTYGGLSQAAYLAIGVLIGVAGLGVPWFADGAAGLGVLLGPSGGYIVGFVFAAALVGWVTDRSARYRRFPYLHGTLVAANLLVYVPGLVGLGWFYYRTGVAPATVPSVVATGFLPFLLGDAIKLVGAAGLGTLIAPKESFGPERDAAPDAGTGRESA